MKTNILVLITLFFTLSFSTKSHAAYFFSDPHCLETQDGYITKVRFTVSTSYLPISVFTMNIQEPGGVLLTGIPGSWSNPGYIEFDISSYNIEYQADCFDYEIFLPDGASWGNSATDTDTKPFCGLECQLEPTPCSASFKVLTNGVGNGMYVVESLVTTPNTEITYMEIFQNGVLISSGPAQSFMLPAGHYRICIVARNIKSGIECDNCHELCLGDQKDAESDWNGIERASEWEKESLDNKERNEITEGKLLDENLKVVISPNPSNGTFVISPLNTKVGMTAIEVYDMNSKLVYSLDSIQNQNRISVDLKDQQSGIYIVKVMYSDGSVGQQKAVVGK